MPTRPLDRLLLVAAALAALAACGGSGGGSTVGEVTLVVEADFDGWVASDGTVAESSPTGVTGDQDALAPGVGFRQAFSFPHAGLVPAGASILAAELRLYVVDRAGAPFLNHGPPVVDHVDLGAHLDGADYASPALVAGLGPIADDTAIGYRALDVTAEVAADVAARRGRSQFRTHLATQDSDDDGASDYVAFANDAYLATFGTGGRPVLRVAFAVP